MEIFYCFEIYSGDLLINLLYFMNLLLEVKGNFMMLKIIGIKIVFRIYVKLYLRIFYWIWGNIYEIFREKCIYCGWDIKCLGKLMLEIIESFI